MIISQKELIKGDENLEFIICRDEITGSKYANNIIKKLLMINKDIVLGLATGTTPMKLYELMIQDNQKGITSYKKVKTYNLDEYVGLSEEHSQSYRYFMNNTLFNYLDIDINNTFVPKGLGDTTKNIEDYDKILNKLGPADIQILGIGSNGHIAFNEPGTDFNLTTHIAKLTESTIKDNSRFFNNINEVPTEAISMGISSILKSKKIILIAFGKNKASAINELYSGQININNPVSSLIGHKDVIVICDKEAACLIKK